jgi:5-methylcytosine-specific restriction endonuclease McrA
MSPVLRYCHRHRAFSPGRCLQCVSDRYERKRIHTDRRGRAFRLSILERDAYTCHWCAQYGDTLDYVTALVDGGTPLDPSNAVAACRSCNSRRGALRA